jgi:hypothetical protein
MIADETVPPAAPLLERLSTHDRDRLSEAVRELLAHGSIHGLDPRQAQLYGWCRQNLDYLREIAVLSGFDIHAEHESRLIQALPRDTAFLLHLRQDATLVLLALWYEYDTQLREQGHDEAQLTVEQLNTLLQEKLLPDLKAVPSRQRLREIMRLAERYRLIRFEEVEPFEHSLVEVLPTLSRVLDFNSLDEWTRTAALHHPAGHSPANENPEN